MAVFLTPLSAAWEWPIPITVFLLALTLVLLFFVGQTMIFLLRLVAADRRADGRAGGRRRPMRSATPTVGQLEDEATTGDDAGDARDAGADAEGEAGDTVAGTGDEAAPEEPDRVRE